MRRLMVCLSLGSAVAIASIGGPASGQQPAVTACVSIVGRGPASGWDPATLATAIANGTATLAWVADPSACAPAAPGQTSAMPSYTITGTLELTFPDWHLEGGRCWGERTKADIQPGALVTVKDGTGALVASARLGEGAPDGRERNGSCILRFEVSDIPESDFYAIGIAGRGDVTFSRAELEAMGWSVGLVL